MNHIKELRKQNGMSQQNLAEQLHITQQAVQQYESGKIYPSTDSLIAMRNLFHTSIDYIIGLSDDPKVAESVCHTNSLTNQELRHLEVYRRLAQSAQVRLTQFLEDQLSQS